MTLSEHKHKFLPGIHGLRALAALSVLLFHQAPNLTLPAFAAPVASHGGMGVQLFFLLSAFSLVHSTQRRVGEPHWLGDYALKRCFRIVPLFYAAMVIFILHDRIIWEIWQPPWKIVLNASLLYNLVPGLHQSIVWAGWTIGIETLFYILFPFLLVFAHGIWRRLLLLAVCVAVSLSYSRAAASLDSIEESYKYMNLLVFLPASLRECCRTRSSRCWWSGARPNASS